MSESASPPKPSEEATRPPQRRRPGGDKVFVAVVAGLFALAGAFLGSTLNSLYANRENEIGRYWSLANTAATDYLSGQAALQLSASLAEERAANLKIREASIRIAVFAPAHIVRAVADYVEILAPRRSCTESRRPEEVRADVEIYRSIRRSTAGGLERVSRRDVAMLLWGCVFEDRGE